MVNWKLSQKAIKQQIADAKEQTRIADMLEPRAQTARYDPGVNRIVVALSNGAEFSFSPSSVQELVTASPKEIAQIEISPSGRTLRWKDLDANLSLPGLMLGVFGSSMWMAHLGQTGGKTTSVAKAAAARLNGLKGGRPVRAVAVTARSGASTTRTSHRTKSVAASALTLSAKKTRSDRAVGKYTNKSAKKK